jgi:hypothetical protein
MLFRVSAEWKSFNDKLNIIMKNIYIHEMITGYKSFLWKTFLVEVLGKLYVRSVKENSHWAQQEVSTHMVSFINTWHLQQDRTNL